MNTHSGFVHGLPAPGSISSLNPTQSCDFSSWFGQCWMSVPQAGVVKEEQTQEIHGWLEKQLIPGSAHSLVRRSQGNLHPRGVNLSPIPWSWLSVKVTFKGQGGGKAKAMELGCAAAPRCSQGDPRSHPCWGRARPRLVPPLPQPWVGDALGWVSQERAQGP